MRKLLFLLFFPCVAHAGSLTLWQNQGGAIGSVVFHPVGQVFFDTSTTSGHPTGVGDMNWNMTVGTGQNRYLIVACATSLNDVPETVLANGNSMTLITSTASASSETGTYIFGYTNPDTGNQGITVHYTSGIIDRGICSSISFFGVDQANAVDFSTGTLDYPGGVTQSVTLTTVSPQVAIVDVIVDISPETLVPGSGQAAVMNNTLSFWAVGSSTKAATAPGSYTMSWTGTQTPTAQSAVSLRPAQ